MLFQNKILHKSTIVWYLSQSTENRQLSNDRLRRVAHGTQSLLTRSTFGANTTIVTDVERIDVVSVGEMVAMLFTGKPLEC